MLRLSRWTTRAKSLCRSAVCSRWSILTACVTGRLRSCQTQSRHCKQQPCNLSGVGRPAPEKIHHKGEQMFDMNSFISWIGGKKLLRDQIIARFPEQYGRYIEV